jgi:hypothetical protein
MSSDGGAELGVGGCRGERQPSPVVEGCYGTTVGNVGATSTAGGGGLPEANGEAAGKWEMTPNRRRRGGDVWRAVVRRV